MSPEFAARQLALPLPFQPRYGADFIPARSNEAPRLWLGRVADWPLQRLALWGETGTGKTHLLHLWARAHGAELLAGATIETTVSPTRPVAIDDADACADERVLLFTLNKFSDAGTPLLMAARVPPARWPVRLPDLRSRLRATMAIEITQPGDDLLRALLTRLLSERELTVSRALHDWLLRRLPRTAAAVREAVQRLDRAEREGRRITRQLAAGELSDLLAG